MYAIKQAMLLNGALPLADITIYYMDIRTFGKGYEQFYQNAQAMGVEFVRGKIAKISEDKEGNPILRLEVTETGEVEERVHDLVVLSTGMVPSYDPRQMYRVDLGEDGFVNIPNPNSQPCITDRVGIFAAGTAMQPMDIVDSIISAGAAASIACGYIRKKTIGDIASERTVDENEVVYA